MIWNSDLVETLEFDNLIGQAVVTMESAPTAPKAAAPTPARTYPERDDANWMKHSARLGASDDGKVRFDTRPVQHEHR